MHILWSEIFRIYIRIETQTPEQFTVFQTSKSYQIICWALSSFRHDAGEVHTVTNKETNKETNLDNPQVGILQCQYHPLDSTSLRLRELGCCIDAIWFECIHLHRWHHNLSNHPMSSRHHPLWSVTKRSLHERLIISFSFFSAAVLADLAGAAVFCCCR